MTANPNRDDSPCEEPVLAAGTVSWNAAVAAGSAREICFLRVSIRARSWNDHCFIFVFCATPSFWLLITFFCFNTFLASYLQLDSVFCNLGESGSVYLLVWFLPFLLCFASLFAAMFHCWVVIIFCTRSHTSTNTRRPSLAVFPLFIRWLRFFPVILLVFFTSTALLHLHTYTFRAYLFSFSLICY